MNKDQAYHQIALACLKALRSPSNSTAENPAENLYKVIDQAFNEQFTLLLMELEEAQTRLKAIAALDASTHSLADAQHLATITTRPH